MCLPPLPSVHRLSCNQFSPESTPAVYCRSSLVENAFVPFSVFHDEEALPPHFVQFPLAFVYFAVGPSVLSEARHFVVFELAGVRAAVGKEEGTFSVFLATLVMAFVHGAVWPSLRAPAMAQVLAPLAHIRATTRVGEGSVTVSHIIEPVTLVCVAISVYHLTIAIGLVIGPLSVIPAAILPCLRAMAALLATHDLAGVFSAIAKSDRTPNHLFALILRLRAHNWTRDHIVLWRRTQDLYSLYTLVQLRYQCILRLLLVPGVVVGDLRRRLRLGAVLVLAERHLGEVDHPGGRRDLNELLLR